MTILFLYNSPLKPEVGGTERATRLVMDELGRRGYETIGLLHADRERPGHFYLNGVAIYSLYDFLVANRVDVVVNQIAYHNWLLSDFLKYGGKEWRNNGGKIISFMHLDPTPAPKKKITVYFEDWDKKSFIGKIKRLLLILYLPFLNRKIDKAYRYGLRYVYDNSDRYILMSESFTKIFSELSGLKDLSKLRYITNMLTFPDIEHPEIVSQKDKTVLVVARLDDEQKNISFIIDVWKSISNHEGHTLHIIGDGQDRMKLEKRASGVMDIIFDGQLNPHPLYKQAKIFLMASPREGWGLTLTESLQCGVVPIVLNTSSVFSDIITNEANGFLVNDQEDFKNRLELLLSNQSIYETMALNGLMSVASFTPNTVGKKWDNLLHELEAL